MLMSWGSRAYIWGSLLPTRKACWTELPWLWACIKARSKSLLAAPQLSTGHLRSYRVNAHHVTCHGEDKSPVLRTAFNLWKDNSLKANTYFIEQISNDCPCVQNKPVDMIESTSRVSLKRGHMWSRTRMSSKLTIALSQPWQPCHLAPALKGMMYFPIFIICPGLLRKKKQSSRRCVSVLLPGITEGPCTGASLAYGKQFPKETAGCK